MRIICIALLFVITSCQTASQKNSTRLPASDFSTLDQLFQVGPAAGGLDLDAWLKGFYSSEITTKLPNGISKSIVDRVNSGTTIQDLYSHLLDYSKNYGATNEARTKYESIAEGFLSARRNLRSSLNAANHELIQQTLFLLELMAEDVMYVIRQKYPQPKQIWQRTFSTGVDAKDACKDSNGESRVARYQGFKLDICSGDIILTKGGAVSSSVLARATDYPGNFSHSYITYVEPQKAAPRVATKGALLQVESWIEDGVKVRDGNQLHYFGNEPRVRKAFVFRANNIKEVSGSINTSVDSMIDDINLRTQQHPLTQPSFEYDFDFNAKDSSKFFCSEIAYHLYENAKSSNNKVSNPYSDWGNVSGATASFFANFLEVKATSFPSPSDLELNPNYQLVGFRFKLDDIGADRVDVAMVDTLLLLAKSNPELIETYSQLFSKIATGQTDVSAAINQLAQLGIINKKSQADLLSKVGTQLPEKGNLKQLVFFGYLNNVLAAKMHKRFDHHINPKSAEDMIGLSSLRLEMQKYLKEDIAEMVSKLKKIK